MNSKRNIFNPLTILFVLILTLTPSTVFASVILIPIGGITTSSSGSTTIERSASEQLEVVIQGWQSSGTVDCTNDQQCVATSLDGHSLLIHEDIRLYIDETTLAITGNAMTLIDGLVPNTTVETNGLIIGNATCVGVAPHPCQTLQLDIQMNGILRDTLSQVELGQFDQQLTAILTLDDVNPSVMIWPHRYASATITLDHPCDNPNVDCGIVFIPAGGIVDP
ncbi:MAG: hypothetical protein AAF614_22020 [Chloroflexota bacterium]